jgi:ubiquinone/menaquinone biosynthesis C-methylase UbiE
MTVIDAGCAMGFFSLPMAKMVGSEGKVICIDLQEKMVQKLFKRAKKKELHKQIEIRVCGSDRLNIDDLVNVADFILASAVIHEVPDAVSFFTELYRAAIDGGKLLVVEPGSHVSKQSFQKTVDAAVKCGFTLMDNSVTRKRRLALFQKTSDK